MEEPRFNANITVFKVTAPTWWRDGHLNDVSDRLLEMFDEVKEEITSKVKSIDPDLQVEMEG